MTHFFNRNSQSMAQRQRTTPQKKFWAAIQQGRHVIASVPMGYPVSTLYSFAAMFGKGMAVVVAPDHQGIQRNLAYFTDVGMTFPEIACLDGTQMPHEERAIREAINHNRVRLLYTTPERFASLTFLEVFVRAFVPFVIVEQADRILSISTGNERYRRFLEEGLGALCQPPPLVLITPPLTPDRLDDVADRYRLLDYEHLEEVPDLSAVHLRVAPVWSEHQKFSRLTEALEASHSPRSSSTGKVQQQTRRRPHPVLIQTGSTAQTEKLGASLIDYGFQSVWMVHQRQSARVQQQALAAANENPDAILINGGFDTQDWQPPAHLSQQIIYWQPPPNLDSLIMNVFRYTGKRQRRPEQRQPHATKPMPLADSVQNQIVEDDVLDYDDAWPKPAAQQPTPNQVQAEDLSLLFQHQARLQESETEIPDRQAILKCLILYTREDFFQAVQNIRNNKELEFHDTRRQLKMLKQYRDWVLSPGCRLKSLFHYYQGFEKTPLPSCGQCDRCRTAGLARHYPRLYRSLSHLFL